MRGLQAVRVFGFLWWLEVESGVSIRGVLHGVQRDEQYPLSHAEHLVAGEVESPDKFVDPNVVHGINSPSCAVRPDAFAKRAVASANDRDPGDEGLRHDDSEGLGVGSREQDDLDAGTVKQLR